MNTPAGTVYVNDPNSEVTQQSPAPTLDMEEQFGAGTKAMKSTGADMAERSLQVQVTNPAIRHSQASTGPVREEKRRLTARAVDVQVRSGNQNPQQMVDKDIAHGFIWGQMGEGDAPVAPPAPQGNFMSKIPLPILLGVAAGGIYLLMRRKG